MDKKRLQKLCLIVLVIALIAIGVAIVMEKIGNHAVEQFSAELGEDDLGIFDYIANSLFDTVRSFLTGGSLSLFSSIDKAMGGSTTSGFMPYLDEYLSYEIKVLLKEELDTFQRLFLYAWAYAPHIKEGAIICSVASALIWFLSGGRLSNTKTHFASENHTPRESASHSSTKSSTKNISKNVSTPTLQSRSKPEKLHRRKKPRFLLYLFLVYLLIIGLYVGKYFYTNNLSSLKTALDLSIIAKFIAPEQYKILADRVTMEREDSTGVLIYYKDAEGNILLSEIHELEPGTHRIDPPEYCGSKKFFMQSEDSVYVDNNGHASPNIIHFYYKDTNQQSPSQSSSYNSGISVPSRTPYSTPVPTRTPYSTPIPTRTPYSTPIPTRTPYSTPVPTSIPAYHSAYSAEQTAVIGKKTIFPRPRPGDGKNEYNYEAYGQTVTVHTRALSLKNNNEWWICISGRIKAWGNYYNLDHVWIREDYLDPNSYNFYAVPLDPEYN